MDEGELFWANLSSLAESFRDASPEGSTALVEVETYDGQTYVPLVVQRRPPWIVFEIGEPDDTSAREIVLLREQDLRRIHMRRERGDKRFGFTLGEVMPE